MNRARTAREDWETDDMVGSDRIDGLERDLAKALAEIDRLQSLEAIRACLYRVCRGIDRVDADLLRSAFHPGAQIHYGKIYEGDVEEWIESAISHQSTQSQRQHMIGNIYIVLQGDEAVAESYELDRHKTPMGGEVRDLVLGARTLDRFARRDGEWRIVERTKVMDWGRTIAADDGVYQNSPLQKGRDDKTDASYQLLA
jgi:hypothetical protein